MHCRLLKWYEDANIVDRHRPFTQFRRRLVGFQKDVKELLNDTLVNSLLLFLRLKPHDTRLYFRIQQCQTLGTYCLLPPGSRDMPPPVHQTSVQLIRNYLLAPGVRFRAFAKSLLSDDFTSY